MTLEVSYKHVPAESFLPRHRPSATAHTQDCQNQLITRKRNLNQIGNTSLNLFTWLIFLF